MISKKMAEELCDIIDEIGDCKKALAMLEEVMPEKPSAYVSCGDKHVTVFLSCDITREAITKQLSIIKTEYKSLNDKAIEEATNGRSEI